jgi:hypothetical protein
LTFGELEETQMRVRKKLGSAAAAGTLFLLCGCGGPGTTTSGGGGKAFLDQKKEVGPHLEWNRDVVAKKEGTITFRVASQGPFSVTVVTEKGYKALQAGDRKALKKEEVLLTEDSKEAALEGKVTLPVGSSWFIIENRTDKKVEMHLQCLAP